MAKRGGLGRGLSALIPGAPEAGETSTGLLEVPTHSISPNPKQPRSHFDDESLAELAASIKEVGILQPLVVRRSGSGYEVVTGERRLRAAKLAGMATVPVVLRESEDSDLLREALIENIHREDLDPIELAEAFRQLLDELGLKQEELADRVGVSRSHIANTIRLLALPFEVQQFLADDKLSAGHARALLALGEADAMTSLSLRVVAEDLSVRETEDIVRRFIEGPAEKKQASTPADGSRTADPNLAEVEEILSEQLATRVQIRMGRKRGQVLIEFGSADDLERIVSEIVGSGPGLAPD
ncbi:MAG TPA: ParB/RepB/Spo0J family partition protein [Actinomycetota bacterium]|nr:ParB/RepB/Spo0J family partition protein [Actinomycetota bacterium]